MDDRTAVRVGFDLVGEAKVRKGDDEVGNCTFSSEVVRPSVVLLYSVSHSVVVLSLLMMK